MPYTREEIRRANCELHTALAGHYKATEPHYRPENVRRVRAILADLRQRTGGRRLLDLGCGAGFVIDIARGLFEVVRGVDLCPAMLAQVDTTTPGADVAVLLAPTDATPFADGAFDVCTAYAVLHHLDALEPTLREAARVLRPGGVLYTDLDPNAQFWQALRALPEDGRYSPPVERELRAVRHKDAELAARFGIPPAVLHAAEHLKHDAGGFHEDELRRALHAAGFGQVDIRYEWFLGEAAVLHGHSPEVHRALRDHFQALLPLSAPLFKYLMVLAQK